MSQKVVTNISRNCDKNDSLENIKPSSTQCPPCKSTISVPKCVLKLPQNQPQLQHQQSKQNTTLSHATNPKNCRILLRKQLQIYTDWANHYLQKRYDEIDAQKASSRPEFQEPQYQVQRRMIQSLSTDLNDGVLLLYIVESVADTPLDGQTANIFRAPRSVEQMLANITVSVQFLHSLGVNVSEIQPKDIHEGNLKTILTLFFNISRFKQALKQSHPSPFSSSTTPTLLSSSNHSPSPGLLQHFSPSGYCSDPGYSPQPHSSSSSYQTPSNTVSTSSPHHTRLLSGRSVRVPGSSSQVPGYQHLGPLGQIAPSPASSASSITSLLSAASLPVQATANNQSSATVAQPGDMISKLPSTSGQLGGYSRLAQPSNQYHPTLHKSLSNQTSALQQQNNSSLSNGTLKRPTTVSAKSSLTPSHSKTDTISLEESPFSTQNQQQQQQTVSGLRAPSTTGSRLSSSISVPKSSRPPSTITSHSGSTTSLTSSISKIQPNSQNSRSKSLALGGLKAPSSSSGSKVSPTSSGSDTSPTSSSQSSSTKSRISSTSASNTKISTSTKNGLKYSGQLSSLKSASGAGGIKVSSIPARRSSSSRPNSRPTSTLMDGNNSLIPASNSPKPTAAVKGVVTGNGTPASSRSNGTSSPQDKKKPSKSSNPEIVVKKEEDSSSSNGSDIEAALAQLEPMAPIQRPTNYGFLKGGNCGNTLPARRNNDDTDNSERKSVLSDSRTLLNLTNRPLRSQSVRSKVKQQHPECVRSRASLGFDETTSSLSTDCPSGLLSPNDISPSTPTTTSSLCSSLSESRQNRPYPPGPPSTSSTGKSSGGSCQSETKSSKSATTNSSGIGSSRKSSIESSNGDLTLVPEPPKRPLSSPSSKLLFANQKSAQLGTKTSLSTMKTHLRPKLSRPEMGPTEVYSDSECLQRSNFMRPMFGHQQHPNAVIRENVYSNTLELYGGNRLPIQYDTDSDAEFQNYSNVQYPFQQVPGTGTSSGTMIQSKPGNLIYEYETMNRAYRETMSASPTFLTKEQQILPVRRQYPNLYDVTRPPPGPIKSQHQQHHQQQQDLNGSSLSLLSSASSSIFTTPEEKIAHESRKLRRELEIAHEKIYTLTSQLGTNAHMVAAFEQSLSTMTNRLQELTNSSDLKDCELDRLRRTIEALKHHGGALVQGVERTNQQRSASISGVPSSNASNNQTNDKLTTLSQRQPSNESVNSISSDKGKKASKSKFKSLTSQNANWIRSSFSKVLSKKKVHKVGENNEVLSDNEDSCLSNAHHSGSAPGSPLPSVKSFKTNASASGGSDNASGSRIPLPESVDELQKALREKDMALTDMRLESLSSAHQLESVKETLTQMRLEMVSLKQDNERLQRLAKHKSLHGSSSSLIQSISQNSQSQSKPDAEGENGEFDDEYDSDEPVILTLEGSLERGSAVRPVTLGSGTHTLATFGLHTKTTWSELDRIIQRLFRDHLIRVDKHLCLGITVDSLACYRVGAEQMQRDLTFASLSAPEMLPFAYLVEESHINLQFKGTLESLTFDTLTPKSILSGYIDTLNRERHLFLGGVSGTGKTYLAHKLAEYLVIQEKLNGNELYVQSISGAIATFVIDHKNSKELCNYLAQLLSDPETLTPMVIILDNVHHLDELLLTKIYNDLERLQNERSVFIIGTLNSEIANPIFGDYSLMPFSVENEPVKGFLERYLIRKWLQNESKSGRAPLIQKPSKILDRKPMAKVIRWLPRVWRFLNKYLMKFGLTSAHAIGPRLFTSCPMDYNGAQIWFADLWNFSILPFITESLREALTKADSNIAEQQQLFSRVKDDDPTEWIIASYPWNVSGTSICEWTDHLNRLKIEDILERDSIDGVLQQRSASVNGGSNKPPSGQNDKVNDPFMQMLLKLKEASNNDSSNDP